MDVTDTVPNSGRGREVASLDIARSTTPDCRYTRTSAIAPCCDRHLAINLLGPYDLTQAVLAVADALAGRRRQRPVVGVACLLRRSTRPTAVSKAAAFSMSQALRAASHRAQAVRVHGVLPGPMDTDMTRELELPKSSPRSRLRGRSSTAWRTRRRKYSPIRCRRHGGRLAARARQGARTPDWRRICSHAMPVGLGRQ